MLMRFFEIFFDNNDGELKGKAGQRGRERWADPSTRAERPGRGSEYVKSEEDGLDDKHLLLLGEWLGEYNSQYFSSSLGSWLSQPLSLLSSLPAGSTPRILHGRPPRSNPPSAAHRCDARAPARGGRRVDVQDVLERSRDREGTLVAVGVAGHV